MKNTALKGHRLFKVLTAAAVLVVAPSYTQTSHAQDDLSGQRLAYAVDGAASTSARQNFARMEAVLNDRINYKPVMAFFHETIHPDAKIEMIVDNPALPAAVNGQSYMMNKQDYINSYLLGSAGVNDYEISIKPTFVSANDNGVETTETLTERGYITNPGEQGRGAPQYFETKTVCNSQHSYSGDVLQLTQSRCKTSVTYESQI